MMRTQSLQVLLRQMSFRRARLLASMVYATSIGVGVTVAEGQPAGEMSEAAIPARFQGAGCNIKYAYVKPAMTKAEECVANQAPNQKIGGRRGDDFIRIRGDQVSGVEWVCKVKEMRGVTQDRMNFSGDCHNEGSPFAASVTVVLRPGKVVSVDTFFDGHHVNNDYRVREGME